MTQRELAVKSGVSVRAISDMERGFSAAPQARTLDALAGALGLDTTGRAALSAAARSARTRGTGAGALPRDLPDFTGRHDELALLSGGIALPPAGLASLSGGPALLSGGPALSSGGPALLSGGHRPGAVTVVHGPPGAGKTAVAVHAAGRLGGRPGFIDCRDLAAGDVLARVRRIGMPCDLLVLDDVTAETQVGPLLQEVGCPVVITSRRALPGLGGIRRVPLGPLPPHDAVRLLATITGAPADHPDVHRVAGFCEHLPLALRAAGNRLVTRPGWTIGDLAVRLADADRRLATLTAGDLSVERVLAEAYATSSPAERHALRTGSALVSLIAARETNGGGPGAPLTADRAPGGLFIAGGGPGGPPGAGSPAGR
ncbi:Helix-turn-helix [Actinoplanes derwentensis]|uniref:Helix-turn-helix n=2 Tax=Actinoplanes derwentensis TaxID=113562 RepID=A0A1H1RHS5_9ACTN|nr:hypothetical protein Ade03nite_33520 [Actinoplanes derwentensis]SDS35291.1 Helix-turn-helix [Actinoplanes derwentensis]